MGQTIALVTGSSGFIGRHLVDRLLLCGMEVRRLVRTRGATDLPAGCVCADYATGAGLPEAIAGVDIVFHLAGVTKALRPSDYFAGNVRAAENLARVAGKVPRFVHVGSLAAVGPSEPGADVTEDTEPHPVSEYGRSKLAGEQAVRRLLPGAVVVRPPVVYGPHDTDVFQMLRAVERGLDVRIGRAERWFSAIYVEDLVEGLIAAARCPAAAGRSYFLTYAEPVSWTAFTATAAGLLGRRPRPIVLPRPAAMAAGWCAEAWSRVSGKPGILSRDKVREAAHPRWTCSSARATRELGFTASTSLDRGLGLALAWYKEQRWL
jgi:nucleoside-diphosphate-sugar epimerase